jgi:hypothetical protein
MTGLVYITVFVILGLAANNTGLMGIYYIPALEVSSDLTLVHVVGIVGVVVSFWAHLKNL